jgi:hypothetical protein
MKRFGSTAWAATVLILAVITASVLAGDGAAVNGSAPAPDTAAIGRARKTALMLDDIYKKTIVMITDKYVHDTGDFAAGSAAVLLFKQISESGTHHVRLLDATGMPYDTENVAGDEFEEEAIKRLKQGAASHEQVAQQDGRPVLRLVSPVPVVMERCIMCHDHYADAKDGEPVGAISYSIPIE